MLIRVLYYDNTYDMVKPWLLEKLIKHNYIQAFYRNREWVYIGRDRIRGMGGAHSGVERRKKENNWSYEGIYLYFALLGSIQSRLLS
ncbi:MAG: GSU3473 family protein [bacterium]